MKFKIDGSIEDTLTWEEFEILQSGEMKGVRPIISRFAVDENDRPIPQAEAHRALGKLKMSEVKDIVTAFGEAMKSAAVNPTNAAK